MITHFPVKFGDYTLHKLIARGGMAEVYRATKAGIGGFEKPAAIKMILPHLAENEEFIAMLTDEARIIVSISHANIAQVYDFCFNSGRYFIAMEYVHGIDVADLFRRMERLGERVALEHSVYIAVCMCAGLHYAHSRVDKEGNPQNIVHRDVSPQNVLLSYAGEVKIIDFGVAKARNRDASTQAGVVKGKLHYMAPEQAKGETVDGRSDIFAAGIVLYELLTGKLPFDGDSEFEIYNNLVNSQPPPPRELNHEVPAELDQIVMRMLERDIEKRFPNGYEAKQALERVLHQIAPGYTNTRLSRYIERMIEREKELGPALPPMTIDYRSDKSRTDSEPFPFETEIKGLSGDDPTDVDEIDVDDGTSDYSGASAPPRRPGPPPVLAGSGKDRPFDSVLSDDFKFEELPPQPSSAVSGRLNSLPLFIALCLVGLIIIIGVSAGLFHLLTHNQKPAPTTVTTTFPAPTLNDESRNNSQAQDEHVVKSVVHATLEEPKETVILTFDTEPTGAFVFLNGVQVGKTPFVMLTEKNDASQLFVFSKENFTDTSYEVVPNESLTHSVALESRGKKQKQQKVRYYRPRGNKKKKKAGSGLIDPFGI